VQVDQGIMTSKPKALIAIVNIGIV